MTERVVFNARQAFYRDPGGAVSTGTALAFRLLVHNSLQAQRVALLLRHDTAGEPVEHLMQPVAPPADLQSGLSTEAMSDYAVYETVQPVAEPGLYWYRFRVETTQEALDIGRGAGSRAVIDPAAGSWQLTVYGQIYETPDWIYGGVFYHIFVDRFYHSGDFVPMEGKRIHEQWGEMPDYLPVDGEILNNDFFGGNLRGITEKLPYLAELGVTCLYLSPIVEAYSNHKYDTADYYRVDPMFGTVADFEALCDRARAHGMRVICDGVFAHTGSDSVYFNKKGHYGDGGAWQDPASPYRDWYFFHEDGTYDAWWGIDTLPRVNKDAPGFKELINGTQGVARFWLAHGAAGWRLDVADELPAAFLTDLVAAAKAEKPDALIIGEVWEDASNKIAYDERKNYFRGDRLDSVMNYPLKDAVIGCVRYGDAGGLAEAVETLWENYPPYVIHALMNHLGTHDSVRILTALAGQELDEQAPREVQAATHLDEAQWRTGIRRLKTAVLLQMTLPGVPCIYYGDEAGTEGYKDPFNRTCFPWGREDRELTEWYRQLTMIRREHAVYATGCYRTITATDGLYAFARENEEETIITIVNCGDGIHELDLPGSYTDLLQKRDYRGSLMVAPGERLLLMEKRPV